jgi:trimeric autotransporter adhesin
MKLQNVIHILVGILCIGLFPNAQAVVPAPDGGYPGFNAAEGQNALFGLTTGVGNTAVGWFSLWSNTDGSFNTGVGAGTLLFNVGDQSTGEGVNDTALGGAALLSNTTGSENTALGTQALFSNTEGGLNTATGYQALLSNTTGFFNTANGAFALFSNTTGNLNTANGYAALNRNTTGMHNTATGDGALFNNIVGDFNTANAYHALFSNISGHHNTADGSEALANATGSGNTALGVHALFSDTTGVNNTALGASAGFNVTTANNVICIGADGQNVSNSCYIGYIFGVTSAGGTAVFINGDGRLGTTTSSRRFKEEVKPMERASEALFGLKPVTFRYKKNIDPAGTPQLGLVAEEVEKVNPALVVRDKEGKPYSVRYDQVNAMLLNEFLKEHRTVEEQQAAITQLKAELQATATRQQKQIESLTAGLQKVSAKLATASPSRGGLEATEPAPQVVNNP